MHHNRADSKLGHATFHVLYKFLVHNVYTVGPVLNGWFNNCVLAFFAYIVMITCSCSHVWCAIISLLLCFN